MHVNCSDQNMDDNQFWSLTLTHCHHSRLHGGEFFDYIAEKEFLIETEAIFYMKQILEGLQYCHSRKIVHLDLKV